METSIIIRTKNEEKWLGKVLETLFNQTYKNFEVIIVDSGSTDKTLNIAQKYPTKIIKIKQEEFSFPFALNIGCKNSVADKYLVMLSAHSLPISNTWLADGISNFTDNTVMGVYGWMKALPDASIWERIFFDWYVWKFLASLSKKAVIKKAGMGVMGFTHAIIRKELWEKYNFNESYGLGGEDVDWSRHWFNRGYVAILDKKFSVYHSHGLSLINFIKQWFYWISTLKPKPFKKLKHRN